MTDSQSSDGKPSREPTANGVATRAQSRLSHWNVKQRCINVASALGAQTKGLSVLLFSLIATLFFPCLPVLIELMKDGAPKHDTILVTATVLAASIAFTAENLFFASAYILLFVFGLIFYMLDLLSPAMAYSSTNASNYHFHHPGTMLGIIALLHSAERSYWHVFLDRPFPERAPWSKET